MAVDESVDFSMAASSGSKMKLGMMKRKIKKKKVQTATGDRKWIKRMFFFVVARSPPATLRVRASSVRVLRERGGVRISRNSPPSPGLFLRRREFRSRLKNNSAGLARAGSFPVDFTATAHLDRSIAIFRLFSLSFSLLLFLSTNQRQRWLCLFSIRSPTSLERFPRFSTNRVERIGRVISFPFLFPFFLNKHVIYV